MRNRTRNACLAVAGFLILLGAVSTSVIAQERSLEGQVIDSRGTPVADATIFLTPLGRLRFATEVMAGARATQAADVAGRVVKSADDGSFSALLPAGRYRIAAFKTGYDVALGEINTLARNTVAIRMDAAPRSPEEPVERDASRSLDWILRHSDGDVLRDREASVEDLAEAAPRTPVASGERAPVAAIRWPSIDGEFRQDLGGAGFLGGETGAPGGSSSRSTRLDLRGGVADRGSWWFAGAADRTLAALDGPEDARRERRSSELAAGLDYRPRAGDEIRTRLGYGASRFLLEGDGSGETIDQDQGSALAQARWDRKLTGGALFYATGSFLQAGVRRPLPQPAPSADEATGDSLVDRSLATAAGVMFPADGHQLSVGMRLHAYRNELDDDGALLARLDPAGALLEQGGRGSAVSLYGRDDWRMAEGYALNYGFGYHGDLNGGAAYVVPRLGLTSTIPGSGDLRIRSTVMYRLDETAGPGAPGERPGAAGDEASRLGYQVAVERSPEDGLQFVATVSSMPFQDVEGAEPPLPLPGLAESGMLVMADAGAARRAMQVELRRGFGVVRGSLAGSVGRVEGRLGPAFEEAPLQRLGTGEARYCLTTLKAMFEPTDTELRIEYRRVLGETEPDASGGAGSLAYRRLDLAVLQDLPWVALANARWRVLMAYQGLVYGALDGPGVPGSGVTSRLSGGVDVSF